MNLHQIAVARNGFCDKFGIPRQSRNESSIETRIVFEPEFRNPDAIRGIEGFSHLWLVWGFSKTAELSEQGTQTTWKATVRPPRLGGNTRMGVFATRSPFRPNPIGLTSVKLLRVEETKEGPVLVVSGADLLNGTPIYDIKPYLRYSDSHPDAVDGFAEQNADYELEIQNPDFPDVPDKVMRDILYILRQDPRPAYQDDAERIYKLDYAGYNVSFNVNKDKVCILNITKSDKK